MEWAYARTAQATSSRSRHCKQRAARESSGMLAPFPSRDLLHGRGREGLGRFAITFAD